MEEEMTGNCNLELQLASFSDEHRSMINKDKAVAEESPKQLIIFYDGRVCVSHVTYLQAKAIIMAAMARREMGEKVKSEPNKCTSSSAPLSMKKSIQRFLQKRSTRIQSSSPYNH